MFSKKMADKSTDPLANPDFKRPGLFENLGEALFGFKRPLLCAQVEVSSACMGKCDYCPHSSQAASWRTRHMNAEIFAALWPLFKLCQRVHLQGWGEPLLHPRFFEFAHLAKKAGCHVSSTSSGLLMNELIAEKILSGDLDLMAFSLAGTDKASNAGRVNVDFAKVCQNIKFLNAQRQKEGKKIELHLAYILLAEQLAAVRKLPELMLELGVDSAVISTLDYLAKDEDRERAFYPEEEDKIAKAREILEEISVRASKNGQKIHYALPNNKFTCHENGCRENVRKSLYIDAEGDVSPCVYLNVPSSENKEKKRVFGNVRQEKILDIWKKGEFKKFRSALIEGQPDPVCKNCPKRLEVLEESSEERFRD